MPKRKTPLITWFNFELLEQVIKKLVKEKKDLKKFSENLGTTYDTLWRMKAENREPIFTVVARLIELTGIPYERWVKIPEEHIFLKMDQQKRGRKYTTAASVKGIVKSTRRRKIAKRDKK